MALSPIDLQTLFSQMDKVGKQEAAQRDGAALLQSIHQAKTQEKTDERIRSVNETQDTGDGTEEIKDKNGGRAGQEMQGRRREGAEEEAEAETERQVISDPDLGNNIDLSM